MKWLCCLSGNWPENLSIGDWAGYQPVIPEKTLLSKVYLDLDRLRIYDFHCADAIIKYQSYTLAVVYGMYMCVCKYVSMCACVCVCVCVCVHVMVKGEIHFNFIFAYVCANIHQLSLQISSQGP